MVNSLVAPPLYHSSFKYLCSQSKIILIIIMIKRDHFASSNKKGYFGLSQNLLADLHMLTSSLLSTLSRECIHSQTLIAKTSV